MKRSTRMLFAALLVLPATGWSQDEPARAGKPVTPASFNVRGDRVQEILRAAAREHSATAGGKEAASRAEATTSSLAVKFRSDDRVDHVDCDALQCYAYARDGRIVYSSPRDLFRGLPEHASTADAWLSCQDKNNLLSTFERYDLCRGIGLSLQMPWNGGPNGVNAPPRR